MLFANWSEYASGQVLRDVQKPYLGAALAGVSLRPPTCQVCVEHSANYPCIVAVQKEQRNKEQKGKGKGRKTRKGRKDRKRSGKGQEERKRHHVEGL